MQTQVKRRRVLFHVGLERTGTTSIQNFCVSNKKALSKKSILYPTENIGFSGNNHIGLAAAYLSHQPLEPIREPDRSLCDPFLSPRRPTKEDVVASLKSEIEKSNSDIAFVSSEHFSSRFGLQQIQTLADDFADYDCRIAIVLRDHVERFYSVYANYIIGGGYVPIDVFGSVMLRDESLEYRYTDLIDLWQRGFGVDKVGVYVFDRNGDALRSFFGPDGPLQIDDDLAPGGRTGWFGPFGYRTNRSLGPRRTAALRAANSFATRLITSNTMMGARMRRRICGIARRALRIADSWRPETGEDRRSSAWGLADEHQRRLLELADADRRQLKVRFGVTLPRAEVEFIS